MDPGLGHDEVEFLIRSFARHGGTSLDLIGKADGGGGAGIAQGRKCAVIKSAAVAQAIALCVVQVRCKKLVSIWISRW